MMSMARVTAELVAPKIDMPADCLRIDLHRWNTARVVVLEGDVDLSTAPALRNAMEVDCLDWPLNAEGVDTVVIDLQAVSFIDSAGLSLLVEIRKRLDKDCQLALLVTRRTQPERVLQLGRFELFISVVHALEELSSAT